MRMRGSILVRRIVTFTSFRNVRYNHFNACRLYLDEFGEPSKVVKKEDFVLDSSRIGDKQVLVKMVMSSINPADINTIQGVYGVKPELPFTLGNEGFGEVVEVGTSVQNLRTGDWVVPGTNAWGTWRSHAIDSEQNLRKIANDLSPPMAATLSVNPCTAYRMLKDFETLKEGDSVIQNAANSAVGQHVIQIGRHMGFKTVNIVRNREGIDKVKEELKDIGADYVLTEEELRSTTIFDSEVPRPKLALNCVGGKSVIGLIKVMADNGTVVTYGGMSRQPQVIPAGAYIFKNLKFLGYWMTRWNWEHKDDPERDHMLEVLCDMARQGVLKPPKHELVPIDNYLDAMKRASDPSGRLPAKLIFKF